MKVDTKEVIPALVVWYILPEDLGRSINAKFFLNADRINHGKAILRKIDEHSYAKSHGPTPIDVTSFQNDWLDSRLEVLRQLALN